MSAATNIAGEHANASRAPSGARVRWLRSLRLTPPPANLSRASGSPFKSVVGTAGDCRRWQDTLANPSSRRKLRVLNSGGRQTDDNSSPFGRLLTYDCPSNYGCASDCGCALASDCASTHIGHHFIEPEARKRLAGGEAKPRSGAAEPPVSTGQRPALRQERERRPHLPTPPSPQVSFVVFHHPALQHRDILVLERLASVMALLVEHIRPHRLNVGRAHGETAISLLPRKARRFQFTMNPRRRFALQLPHHIREAMRGAQPREHMHMIRHATHRVGDAVHGIDHTTEASVDAVAMLGRYSRFPVLRAEHEMVVQREVCRGHYKWFSRSGRSTMHLRERSGGSRHPLRGFWSPPAHFFRASGSKNNACGTALAIECTRGASFWKPGTLS